MTDKITAPWAPEQEPEPSKYPCLDGINRDKAIEEYMRLGETVDELDEHIDLMRDTRDHLHYRMSRIRLEELGGMGLLAVDAAKAAKAKS